MPGPLEHSLKYWLGLCFSLHSSSSSFAPWSLGCVIAVLVKSSNWAQTAFQNKSVPVLQSRSCPGHSEDRRHWWWNVPDPFAANSCHPHQAVIECANVSCPSLSVHLPLGSVDTKIRNKSQNSSLQSSLDFDNRASERARESEGESVNHAKQGGREEDGGGRRKETEWDKHGRCE